MTCQLDLIPVLRNHVAHGNIHLLPQGALASLQLCKAVIEKLYPAPPITALGQARRQPRARS